MHLELTGHKQKSPQREATWMKNIEVILFSFNKVHFTGVANIALKHWPVIPGLQMLAFT